MAKFIFDLDGTITAQETLPLIAKHFKIQEEINRLTEETIHGNIPFVESFIRRVYILGKLPINEVSDLLAGVPMYPKVLDFIKEHQEDCIVGTGNLECWLSELSKKIACPFYCSTCSIKDNKVEKLTYILKKENIVERYKNAGEKVVFIGDGNNDTEAMRLANIAIASGLTHMPAKSVLDVASYLVFTEEALCRQLNQLL